MAEGRRLLERWSGVLVLLIDLGGWGLPGGVMEPGESLLQALHREVAEETGLAIHVERLLGLYTTLDFEVHYPNGDVVHPVTAGFLARPIDQRGHL